MITESILNFCFNLVNGLLNIIPNIPTLTIPDYLATHIHDLFNLLNYIFPMNLIKNCIFIILGYYLVKFIISIVKFVIGLKVPGL